MVAAGDPPAPPQVPHEPVQALARAVALRRVDLPAGKRVVHDPHTHTEYRPAREAAQSYKTYILSQEGRGESTQIRGGVQKFRNLRVI